MVQQCCHWLGLGVRGFHHLYVEHINSLATVAASWIEGQSVFAFPLYPAATGIALDVLRFGCYGFACRGRPLAAMSASQNSLASISVRNSFHRSLFCHSSGS